MHRISDPGVLDLCDAVCVGIEAQLEEIAARLGAGAA
jgi:hypothetical protein